MDRPPITAKDRQALEQHGIPVEEALRQMELFKNPPGFTRLLRPCLPGDGIIVLSEAQKREALSRYEKAQSENRFQKMVPASGAATRMFSSLLWFRKQPAGFSREECQRRAEEGEEQFRDLLRLIGRLEHFAFSRPLHEAMHREGHDTASLQAQFNYEEILRFLLSEQGLDCASQPKGLIPFHRYGEESRTPFEEHLVEAALYARNASGTCKIHFTVSPAHKARFQDLCREVAPRREAELRVKFEVSFSEQKASTDTLAVDPQNRIFREKDGRPLLRPGGHGALLENLDALRADILFVKNIDNVSPLQLDADCVTWKKVLAGVLAGAQERIFCYLSRICDEEPKKDLLDEALLFAQNVLSASPPAGARLDCADRKKEFLLQKLNRPVRVCGMVAADENPGGGPFWVVGQDGAPSLQIVEAAQVDRKSQEQRSILESATHFNPVDLVCGLRDFRGRPFDLKEFIDPRAVFISTKSREGKQLKALERPGLWNGAMADWNTIFVEVPPETFSPVKTVVDLLSDAHQYRPDPME